MRQTFDGAAFGRMICSAAASIELKKQKINELNVFPVPDGDTGTNMSMTLGAAAAELRRKPDVTLTKAADVAASALLRGARGNSGVILSLLFRGFSKALKGMEQADGRDFAAALTTGVEAAYKAVMKPAEGTILTVSRLTADAARDLAAEDHSIESVLAAAIPVAKAALDNTVNQNPVLKKAGVVDAGGMGFVVILEGMLSSLQGNDIVADESAAVNEQADFAEFDSEDITFAFDTVFIVRKSAPAPQPPQPEKRYGVVAVCAGEGLASVFTDLGADRIIEGGQTMNPSTEDILSAVEQTPAEIVFVLPNNKNIILAAQAAAELAEKDVIVIESKTVPQGITALLNFDAELDVQENPAAMTASLSTVTTMQVTYAARNSDFDGHDIHEGDYLGLCDGALLAVTPDLTAILTKMAEKAGAEDHAFTNIVYGCDISEADAEAARDIFAQHAPDAEINLLSGGQPIYYYLISAE